MNLVRNSSQLIPQFVGNGMGMAIESADIASEKIESTHKENGSGTKPLNLQKKKSTNSLLKE